jgi:hypothetical protein
MVNALLGGLLLAATSVSAQLISVPASTDFYEVASIRHPGTGGGVRRDTAAPPPPSSPQKNHCAAYGGPRHGLVCLGPGILGVCDERNGNLFQKGVCDSGTCCGRTVKGGPASCSAAACELLRPVEEDVDDVDGDVEDNDDDDDDDGNKKKKKKRQLMVPGVTYDIPEIPGNEDK